MEAHFSFHQLAAFIHRKLCLAHVDVVSTCESAHYLIKQNNNHSSIGNSAGLFIIVMLPSAIMTSMVLYLKHAKNDWIPRTYWDFWEAHEYRFQAVFSFFPGVQCLHRGSQDSGANKLVNTSFNLKLSWIIHIHTTHSMHQEILNVSHDWFEFHSKLTNGCN